MIKNIFKTIRGFSPVELVIMVGFGALAAAALIYLGTTPHYMASSQPVNVNIKVDGATASRQPAAKAEEADIAEYLAFVESVSSNGADKGNKIGLKNPAPGHIKGADGKPAQGGESEIWVYPMGVDETTNFTYEDTTYQGFLDSVNVQWALDNVATGGKVKLMAGHGGGYKVFYFGEPGSGAGALDIHQSLTLEGEVLSSVSGEDWSETGTNYDFELPDGTTMKSDRTTIYGGGGAEHLIDIYSGANSSVTIKGLRFEGFGRGFLWASDIAYQDLNVNNNVINSTGLIDTSVIVLWNSSNVTLSNNTINIGYIQYGHLIYMNNTKNSTVSDNTLLGSGAWLAIGMPGYPEASGNKILNNDFTGFKPGNFVYGNGQVFLFINAINNEVSGNKFGEPFGVQVKHYLPYPGFAPTGNLIKDNTYASASTENYDIKLETVLPNTVDEPNVPCSRIYDINGSDITCM